MSQNYIERLRIAIDIKNIYKLPTSVNVNLNNKGSNIFELTPGMNTIIYDCTIYEVGKQNLQIKIAADTSLKISDLRVHGLSISTKIYACTYNDHDSVLNLIGPGIWKYSFETPIHEHALWRIGLV